jgi:hypothetical protein
MNIQERGIYIFVNISVFSAWILKVVLFYLHSFEITKVPLHFTQYLWRDNDDICVGRFRVKMATCWEASRP